MVWFVCVGKSFISGGGDQGCYGGHSVWNQRGELSFTGRRETTAELGVREGGLVTTPTHPLGWTEIVGHWSELWGGR